MIDINLISQEYVKCVADRSRIYMITHYLKTYDATQRKEVPFDLFQDNVTCALILQILKTL